MIHRRRLALRIYAIGLAQVAALASRVRLARRILEAHRGTLEIESRVGEGTVARIRCRSLHGVRSRSAAHSAACDVRPFILNERTSLRRLCGGVTKARSSGRAEFKRRTSHGRGSSGIVGRTQECQTARRCLLHEEAAAGVPIPAVGRSAARSGTQAHVSARERSASGSPPVPQGRAARDGPHPARGLEPPHASLLPRAPPRIRARVRKVRVPPGALLGAGQPRALRRRGARRADLGQGDEGAGGPDGARAQQGNGPEGRRVADRYHAHILASPREAANAVRYVLENWKVHAVREGQPAPSGVDPFCSAACLACGPPPVAEPLWWMLRVGIGKFSERAPAA